MQFPFLFVPRPSSEVTAFILTRGLYPGSRDPDSVMIRSAGWKRLQTLAKLEKKRTSLQCMTIGTSCKAVGRLRRAAV